MEQRHISVEQAKASREVFLVGSSLPIMPVVQVRSIHALFAGERGLAAACPACRWHGCAPGPTRWVFRGCCCRRGRDEGGGLGAAPWPRIAHLPAAMPLSHAFPSHPLPSSPQWDTAAIGDGSVGIVALQIRSMMRVRAAAWPVQTRPRLACLGLGAGRLLAM